MHKSLNEENHENFLFEVADLIIKKGLTLAEAEKELEHYEKETDVRIYRKKIYAALHEAFNKHIIVVRPKREEILENELRSAFDVDNITVVDSRLGGDAVPYQAALRALEFFQAMTSPKSRFDTNQKIGIGLGPGTVTAECAVFLGGAIRREDIPIDLELFPLTAGAPPMRPEEAPVSFFNQFPKNKVKTSYGLFAPNLIPAKEFKTMVKRPGVREAYDAKSNIDLIITSMGAVKEPDILTSLLKEQMDIEELRNEGWVGNVQYRPFSETGPIKEKPNQWRAVTLFELDELVEMADRKRKHIILMARGKDSEALLPLLANKKLRVFSEIILDKRSATNVLATYEKQQQN